MLHDRNIKTRKNIQIMFKSVQKVFLLSLICAENYFYSNDFFEVIKQLELKIPVPIFIIGHLNHIETPFTSFVLYCVFELIYEHLSIFMRGQL